MKWLIFVKIFVVLIFLGHFELVGGVNDSPTELPKIRSVRSQRPLAGRFQRYVLMVKLPKRVTVNQNVRVEVVLVPDTMTKLVDRLEHSGFEVIDTVRGPRRVKLALRGSGLSAKRLLRSDTTSTNGVIRWIWEIKPSKVGKVALQLKLRSFSADVQPATVFSTHLVMQVEEKPGSAVRRKSSRDEAVQGGESPPTDELTDAIDKALEQLPVGQIMFNPPEKMRVGKKERIEVRVSRSLSEDLTRDLKGSGVPQVETVKVSALMKVRLLGDAFEIIPLNEEEQIVTRSGFTQWAWDVTPLQPGRHELHLVVSVKLRIAGVEKLRDYPVIDRTVYVEVNPGYAIKNFLRKNWRWLLTAIIIPFGGKWLRDWKKRRKERKKAEKEDEDQAQNQEVSK
ncbi:MAG: hypothetical protein DRQ10_00165 [Candidatus Hydrothermota bacterium]|nr:MAG: hypothetical protein DRQ10_00165 [Candidatus Hydrothermae bacterium]